MTTRYSADLQKSVQCRWPSKSASGTVVAFPSYAGLINVAFLVFIMATGSCSVDSMDVANIGGATGTFSAGGSSFGGVASTTGGTASTSGSSGFGGVSNSGGSLSSGGALGTGNTTSTGGSSSGGFTSTGGGIPSIGGTTATGGGSASGGFLSSTGGYVGTVGTTTIGGSSGLGGVSTAGGALSSGGVISAGGTIASGGASGVGGTWAVCGNGPMGGDAGIGEPPTLTAVQGLMVEDFEGVHHDDQDNCQRDTLQQRQAAPNYNTLGYCSECFSDCAQNYGGIVETSLLSDPCTTFRSVGHSLKLQFNLTQGYRDCGDAGDPNTRFAGYVQLLTGNDICPSNNGTVNPDSLGMTKLTFWLRTDSGSEDFQLEVAFKDLQFHQSDTGTGKPLVEMNSLYLGTQVWPGGWRKVTIPFTALQTGGVDFTQLREINFTFSTWRAKVTTVTKGAIFLDEIAFER